MNKILSTIISSICIASIQLLAFDQVPSKISSLQMKQGRRVDKIWIGPRYNRYKGFTVSEVNYDVKVTNEVVVDYLPVAFNSIGKNRASHDLVVTVRRFSEKVSSVRPYNTNSMQVDGQIFDKDGRIVAAFQIDRTFPLSIEDTKAAIDAIVLAVKKDLLW